VAVYVDKARNPYGRMLMSHMLADSLDELHAMAEQVGLKRRWFQSHGTPHYDLCQAKRALAIGGGALEIDRREVVRLIRHWRAVLQTEQNKLQMEIR